MAFLYKHYEKIVIAVFLLVFVFALVYLIFVFSQSKDIKEGDLRIRPQGEDYTRIFDEEGKEGVPEGQKGRFSAKENLKDEKHWVPSTPRDPNALASTKFMISFPAARCDKCLRVVPKAAFIKKECPMCRKDPGIFIPPSEKILDENKDTDGDGMPDKFEKSIEGMNFEDPADKFTDLDKDGFSNFTEFEAKTVLNDTKSHPPLADRLALIGIKRKLLSIKLVNVDKRNSVDKKEWLITLKVIGKRGKYVTEFKKIGDTVKLDSRKNDVYKITDAEYKITEKFDKRLNRPVDVNASEVKIQNIVNSEEIPIKVVIGQSTYENRVRLGFIDTISNKKYIMKDGDKFSVGDATLGTEEYKVISIDLKAKEWVKIEDANKKQFEIGKESKIDKIKSEFGDVVPDIPPDGSFNEYIEENLRRNPNRPTRPSQDDNLQL